MQLELWGVAVGLTLFACAVAQQNVDIIDCHSEIFCEGELLSTIQMARLYNDSKTFVDMKLRQSPEITLSHFRAFQLEHPNAKRADIQRFVDENFEPVGSEFEKWTPDDHVDTPSFLSHVRDPVYRQFGQDLHDLWLQLSHKMKEDVYTNSELYSMIPVPNPVIAPGGRFREFYYWDSYWVILGLLRSEMYTTTRGILANFVYMVDNLGFIPNGGRIYYMGRTQPPLLIPMVKEYLDATNDIEFVRSIIGSLEREFQYFLRDTQTVVVKGHRLSHYAGRSRGPRPESYYEDKETAEDLETEEQKAKLYAELKAGAESGMDYSSRWFVVNGTNEGTLLDTKCTQIVPVELNSILYWNAHILSELFFRIGNNAAKENHYGEKANELYRAIQDVFWHEDVGVWLDWDYVNNQRRNYFVPTNLAPLWTNAFDYNDRHNISARVMRYINNRKLDLFPGGVPNSLENTGEQWDFPNAWPPMQHLLIEALRHLDTPASRDMSFRWASKWVYTNYVAYNRTQSMFEKYSALQIGLGGSGGEYAVQLGFGWSNGIILDLLYRYGDRLESRDINRPRGV